MKRKIALALASLMTLSAMSMNTFAASSNTLTGYTTSVPRYTVFLEREWGNVNYTASIQDVYNSYAAGSAERALIDELAAYAAVTPIVDASGSRNYSSDRLNIHYTEFESDLITYLPARYQATSQGALAAINVTGNTLSNTQTSFNKIKNTSAMVVNENGTDIAYAVSGTNFVMTLGTDVRAGESIRLNLNGASWYFRNTGSGTGNYGGPTTTMTAADVAVARSARAMALVNHGNPTQAYNPQINVSSVGTVGPRTAAPAIASANSYDTYISTYGLPRINYNPNYGWYVSSSSSVGVYYRYGNLQTVGRGNAPTYTTDTVFKYNSTTQLGYELSYALAVSTIDSSVAVLTFLEDGNAGDGIVVPLVIRAGDSNADVSLTVMDDSTGGKITTGTWRVSNTGNTALTSTTVGDNGTQFREKLALGRITVTETRLNSIKTNHGSAGQNRNFNGVDTTSASASSTIQLVAPAGFYFGDIGANSSSEGVRVGLEYGLRWSDDNVGYGRKYTGSVNYSTNRDGGLPFGSVYLPSGYDYMVEFKRTYSEYEYDESIIEITLRDIKQSENLLGKLYITGVVLYAENNTSFSEGDVTIDIKNKDNSNRPVIGEAYNVKVGVRKNWNISLTAGTPTNLVAGRYEMDQTNGAAYGMLNATDSYHKTAWVEIRENVTASWWAQRETVFTLSDGAKFRKVEFIATDSSGGSVRSLDTSDVDAIWNTSTYTATIATYQDGLTLADSASNTVRLPNAVYVNDGVRHGRVTLSETTLVLNNMTPSSGTARRRLRFQPWVSLEVGHGAHDLEITLSGTALTNETAGNSQSIVIAKVTDPIEVETNMTDLKIGYQYQTTGDIFIKETAAGVLLRGKQMLVAVTDMISMDMLITPEAKVEVVEGDLKISNFTTFSNGYASRNSYSLYGGLGTSTYNGGTLGFNIERASSKASTVKISNVALKVDRTVPETNNRDYQIVVWGSAVAENFGQNRDEFAGRVDTTDGGYTIYGVGVAQPYVKVVSVAPERTGILTGEVHVSIGENYILVDGTAVEMDAAAYISPASNSTMVPIRFVANAFGVTNDQIIYDEVNRTVTLIHPTRTIQFTTGSAKMLVNGAEITMVNAEGVPVIAENKGDRMYIPFRFIGNAFGVYVDWDPTTQTAKYIPQN